MSFAPASLVDTKTPGVARDYHAHYPDQATTHERPLNKLLELIGFYHNHFYSILI